MKHKVQKLVRLAKEVIVVCLTVNPASQVLKAALAALAEGVNLAALELNQAALELNRVALGAAVIVGANQVVGAVGAKSPSLIDVIVFFILMWNIRHYLVIK